MRRFATILAAGVLLIAVVAGALFVNAWYFKPITIDVFYASLFARLGLGHPELLSELRIVPSWLDFYGDKLDDASPALGPKFDLAQFHNEILIHGSLPLVVLERVIDEWIARVKAA